MLFLKYEGHTVTKGYTVITFRVSNSLIRQLIWLVQASLLTCIVGSQTSAWLQHSSRQHAARQSSVSTLMARFV